MSPAFVLDRTWNVHLSRTADARGGLGRTLDPLLLLLGGGLASLLSYGLHEIIEGQRRRRMAVEKRAELEGQLQHSQKMEAVGRLAGGVAHDFNNLLTTIPGNADMIEDVALLDKRASNSLKQIRIAGEHATQLTSKLLTISRKQVKMPRQIDFNQEIRTLDSVLQALVRENIEFIEALDSKQIIVELDTTQLSQVLINLVVNTVDAMPDGGVLRIATQEVRGEDTGTGMDAETMRCVLEPFFTTKGAGTGLGLATVDGIATGAGGAVEISANSPHGTRVSVWLPISSKPLDTPPILPTVGFQGMGRALIVEDQPSVRDIGARLLRNPGYQVTDAADGAAALKIIQQKAEFGLIFTDVVMPRLGGKEMLQILGDQGQAFHAVITSGYSDELKAEDIQRLDAVFLAKPYNSQALRKAIQESSRVYQP